MGEILCEIMASFLSFPTTDLEEDVSQIRGLISVGTWLLLTVELG